MRCFGVLIWVFSASFVLADTVLPTRVIRPRTIIVADAVAISGAMVAGAYSELSQVIGQEARVALYPKRPIHPGDIGPPAVIERNQLVSLIYQNATLSIKTGGRSMGRAAVGETIRVMNLGSRATVMGIVRGDGSVVVLH